MHKIEIKCPKCGWMPDGGEHWCCTCGHSWNTFDTGGVCPACNKKWEDTQCGNFDCREWSKHMDWYLIRVDKETLTHLNSDIKSNKDQF